MNVDDESMNEMKKKNEGMLPQVKSRKRKGERRDLHRKKGSKNLQRK